MSAAATAKVAGTGSPYAAATSRRQQQYQHHHQQQRVRVGRVDRYDGQTIYSGGRARYELGNYLGGGAAGVVYEATDLRRGMGASPFGGHEGGVTGYPGMDPAASAGGGGDANGSSVAIKILNPVGFRLLPSGALQKCLVAVKGAPLTGGGRARLAEDNVWWLVHSASKAVVAAYLDPKLGTLRELPLPKCIEIWGWDGMGGGADHARARPSSAHRQQQQQQSRYQQRYNPAHEGQQQWADEDGLAEGKDDDDDEEEEEAEAYQESKLPWGPDAEEEEDALLEKVARWGREVLVAGGATNRHVPNSSSSRVWVPRVPAKYLNWLRSRRRIYKEIRSMERLGAHPCVVRLHEVLELLQDSKSTLFLVLELVTGGELFDRIPLGCGATEETARRYFRQLLSGVGYCHARGVCHRDIKPENLLLDEHANLKIADFGLSTAFSIAACGGGDVMLGEEASGSNTNPNSCSSSAVRRLRSVVGSPHYCAPEVTYEGVSATQGYDGRKADAWSCGVILYAMLVGTLPFGRELGQCPRFHRFRRWLTTAPAPPVMPLPAPDGGGIGGGGGGGGGSPLPASGGGASSSSSSSSRGGSPVVEEGAASSGRSTTTTPWLFPTHISPAARALVVQLLHPDPARRLSIEAAARQPWVLLAGGDGGQASAGAAFSSAAAVGISVEPSSAAAAAAAAGAMGAGGAGSGRSTPSPTPSPNNARDASGPGLAAGSMSMQAVMKALRSLSSDEPDNQDHQQQQQQQHLLTQGGLTIPSPPPPPILEGDEWEEEEEAFSFSASPPGRPA